MLSGAEVATNAQFYLNENGVYKQRESRTMRKQGYATIALTEDISHLWPYNKGYYFNWPRAKRFSDMEHWKFLRRIMSALRLDADNTYFGKDGSVYVMSDVEANSVTVLRHKMRNKNA